MNHRSQSFQKEATGDIVSKCLKDVIGNVTMKLNRKTLEDYKHSMNNMAMEHCICICISVYTHVFCALKRMVKLYVSIYCSWLVFVDSLYRKKRQMLTPLVL